MSTKNANGPQAVTTLPAEQTWMSRAAGAVGRFFGHPVTVWVLVGAAMGVATVAGAYPWVRAYQLGQGPSHRIG